MTPDEVVRAAGLTAGSIPTKGKPGYMERSGCRAAAEAVLQAMAMVVAPRSMSHRDTCAVIVASSSRSLTPYGARA
jgi:hypothetical protein